MVWGKTFKELDRSLHDRKSFDCGESELNTFIQTQALRHMKAGISLTMVLPEKVLLKNQKPPICSFYSVAPNSVRRDTFPQDLAKKLPQYPVPVFLLAQLAVHKQFQDSGLGKITLIKSLEYLWEVNSYMRAYAVVVDCINRSAQSFYSKYGFEFLCEQKGRIRMLLPMKTIGRLFDKQ